jgi:hypothetical protein
LKLYLDFINLFVLLLRVFGSRDKLARSSARRTVSGEGPRQTPWASEVVVQAWAKPWVVDCRSVGNGASALNTLPVVHSAWTSFCFPKMIDFSYTLCRNLAALPQRYPTE